MAVLSFAGRRLSVVAAAVCAVSAVMVAVPSVASAAASPIVVGGGYQAAVLADDPVAYWPMNADTGTTMTDITDNGNDGVYSSGPNDFDGANDVTVPTRTDAGAGTSADVTHLSGSFTVEAWVSPSVSDPGGYGILGSRFGGDNSFDVKLNNNLTHGDLGDGSNWYSNNLDAANPDGNFTAGLGYYVAVVVDATDGTWTSYINGTEEGLGTGTNAPLLSDDSHVIHIGQDNPGEYFDGSIGQVAVYDSALSASDIAGHWTAGALPQVGSLSQSVGPVDGGTPVQVHGSGFTAADTVVIGQGQGAFTGALTVPGADTTFVNSEEIDITTPGGAQTGTWNLFVIDASNNASPGVNGDLFTYLPAGVGLFTTPGESIYSVPAGTTALHVTVIGAAGQDGPYESATPGSGGAGAQVETTIPITGTTPSDLYVEVDQNGGAGGYNWTDVQPNGASGGGASDIQTCSVSDGSCTDTADPASDPRLVVAGGGGGGGQAFIANGGNGGNAGNTAASVGAGGTGGYEGDNGSDGGDAGMSSTASPATGGAGGQPDPSAPDGYTGPCDPAYPDDGAASQGGDGAANQGGLGQTCYEAGGGGGGGWAGGGGGGGGISGAGGGGGAGSSFVEDGATDVSLSAAGHATPEVMIIPVSGATATPVVSSLSVNTGPIAGGTPVQVFGSNFTAADTVVIGQGQGAFTGALTVPGADTTFVNSEEIDITTPGGAQTGTWNLFVIDASNNASPGVNGDLFTYLPAGVGLFTTPGESIYSVPAGTTALHVTVIGAAGQDGPYESATPGSGGAGAQVETTIPITGTTPSDLYVEVDQNGGAGGYNWTDVQPNGASGGGASDIQTCSVSDGSCTDTADPASDPRLVVAGGGGGGGQAFIANGGNGGNAGNTAASVGAGGTGGYEGDNGSDGGDAGMSSTASPATGGAGGQPDPSAPDGYTGPCDPAYPDDGAASQGGDGAANQGGLGQTCYEAGGGGGGGWAGGGGGGGGISGAGGGGGAGSSFVEDGATDVSLSAAGHATPEVMIIPVSGATATPVVSSLSVNTGPIAGGTPVQVFGSNFTAADTVVIGQGQGAFTGALTVPGADTTFVNSEEIDITTPGGAQTGTWNLFVIDASNNASPGVNGDLFTYTLTAAPVVSSLSVNTGPIAGGTPVQVFGSNFTAADTVVIGQGQGAFTGALTVPGDDTTFVNSGEIDITTPGGAQTGTWNLFVIDASNNVSPGVNGDLFTYTLTAAPVVSSLSVNTGPIAGGTPVQVFGSNFTAADTVVIGQGQGAFTGALTVPGDDTTFVNSGEIDITTPGGAQTGTWNLFVIDSSNNVSPGVNGDLFTYT